MKREVKIGIFAVLMIGCAWAGIRFLSGIDIFRRNSEYYAAYDRINGVQAASPVIMQGVKVGTVTGIRFDPRRSDKVVLQLTIKRQYALPADSEAQIVSNSIMGAKAVEIRLGESSEVLRSGDTLRAGSDRDLMDMAGSGLEFLKQKVERLTGDLSRTLGNINALLEANAAALTGTMTHLNGIAGNLDGMLAAERGNLEAIVENLARFSETLGGNAGRIDSIVRHADALVAGLEEQRFAENLAGAAARLNELMTAANSGDGTLGALLGERALYDSLTAASGNLASLLADLEARPGRYVHFSLFGRNEEKMQERARKRAEREAARAGRDSLRRMK